MNDKYFAVFVCETSVDGFKLLCQSKILNWKGKIIYIYIYKVGQNLNN